LQITQSPALYSLDDITLAKVLQSDFLQCTEMDILHAVINWSEHQLIRQMESQGTCFHGSGLSFSSVLMLHLVVKFVFVLSEE